MKCPECDGTGKVVHPMMTMNGDEYTGEWEQYECEMCGGAGVIQGQAPSLVSCCPACDGKGFIEMTNEEWLCGLSTEEKAKFMCDIYEMGKNGKEYFMRLDKAVEWLKEMHNEKHRI